MSDLVKLMLVEDEMSSYESYGDFLVTLHKLI